MKEGVININKPAGWTSQDVCAKLRHRLHIKKIGHTGTLDPMATGVLPVCIGKASRIIEYYDLDRKTYRVGMRLGITSDTLDIWGNTETLCSVRIVPGQGSDIPDASSNGEVTVAEDSIREAFRNYTGQISQIPPKFSALRINGRRAYDLARAGTDFELKARQITVFSNEITSIDPDACEIGFEVTCSKGTYVRTICDDIGRELGCGAVMTSLVRTKSGFFSIEDASDIEEITELSDSAIDSLIIPMEDTLLSLGTVQLDNNRFTAFINGNSSGTGFRVSAESDFTDSTGSKVYKVFCGEQFLGTAAIRAGQLIPSKVIHR